MNWELISEVNDQLSETELRYYNDIYVYCCDSSDPENVPVLTAAELYRSANLPREVTLKILEICSGPKSNIHMGRKQFYCSLKLVAAHQSGIDINRDLTTDTLSMIMALPRFSWPTSGDEDSKSQKIMSRLPESTTESESDAESPRETGGSTDSPTPTNSVTQERIDGLLGSETILDSASGSWQGLLVSEEQRQLLGTEEESSERHSSDDDGASFPPDEVWVISDEQREYYAAQFGRLQPDPDGLLAGPVARTFFEKSRLPVAELRRIWQLADVTRDGALSLPEFYVAMHLVVLRRNHVPLPDVLPVSLAISLGAVGASVGAPPPPPPPPPPPTPPESVKTEGDVVAGIQTGEKSKEWTKFVDSPTGSGSLTSPGPKPVNFDFQKSAVERDPKILHPVPLRLTPEAAILASGANGSNGGVIGDEDVLGVGLVQRVAGKKIEEGIVVTPKKDPPPPPPPRPYRTHTRSSSLDLNKLGKNGQNFLGAPPSVPPRVSPGSSSPRKLVGQKSECDNHRTVSESQGFVADFSHFSPKGDDNTERGEGEDETGKDDTDSSKQLTLEELREKNAELRSVCEELTRELASALQERINLRAKLLLIT
ncbi:ralBP1-associated Eps domain-containing protein 2 isoform X3 [Fopius arisanus]|uniref:RalBP1-associated Eps domain-containing protein 2 isoform X3 n=1 Tax=Fopius arisanus TaxID=64838 RepID=A0A9R1TSC2_9HYME|nr:PREDICTED: ralBP1-associated Eps domain-containing protein 2 isoform X3 [Fopius arisanus]